MLRKRSRQVSKNHMLSDHFSTKITEPASYFSNSSLIFHGLFNFEQNSMNIMMSSELESNNNSCSGESESGSEGETEGFLWFCHQCNLELGHGKDIFMYRGEKAFCSQECRYQEMLFDAVDNN